MKKILSLLLILCMILGVANFSVLAETVNFIPAADSTFGNGGYSWKTLGGGILKETDNPVGPGKVLCYSDIPNTSYASPQIDVRSYVQNNVKKASTVYVSMDVYTENDDMLKLLTRIRTTTKDGFSMCKETGAAYCSLGTVDIYAGQWNRITVSFNVTQSDLYSTEPWNFCFDGISSKTKEPVYIDNFYIGLDEENPLSMPEVSDGQVENFLLPADSTFETGTSAWNVLSAGKNSIVDNPSGEGKVLCYSNLDPSKTYASPQLDIRSAIQENVDKATTIYGAIDIYCEKDIVNAIIRLRTTTSSGFSMCEEAGATYCTIGSADALAGEWTRVTFSFVITEKDLSSTEPWNLCFDGIAKNLTAEDKIYIDNVYIGVDKPILNPVENKPIPEKTQVSRFDNTLVGTIRWDAFTKSTPDGTDPASQVARVLSPKKYHGQAPFFSIVNEDDTIAFPEYTVETWEKEAEYAKKGGLDYFAYLWYETDDNMSQPRKLHLQSEKKDTIKMCGILGNIYSKKAMNELWDAMKDSCYLSLDGRPLLFLYGAEGSKWTKEKVDQLRQDAANAGIEKALYIIGMCDSANITVVSEVAAKGVDGVSWYGESAWSTAETFATLAARDESRMRNMSEYASTCGIDIIPTFTSGRDSRARIETGVSWVDGDPNATNDDDKPYKNRYALQPTMTELENHITNVLEYTQNSSAAKTNIVCSYAWNEHEEGGWLCPTVTVDENGNAVYNSDGTIKANTERLDALKSAKENVFGVVPTPTPTPVSGTIKGASVDIGASLTINYFAEASTDDVKMKFTSSSGKVTEVSGIIDEQTGCYKFAYEGINPQCMNDNIKAELIYGEEVLDTKETYSVKNYCENQKNRSAESLGLAEKEFECLKTLMADMLVYGSASQEYKNYNTSNLADSAEWVSEYKSTFEVPVGVRIITGNTDTDNQVTAVGVNMANVNKIYFKIKITDDITVKINDKEIDKSTLAKNDDGIYLLYSDGIKATQFDKIFTLQLLEGGNEITKVEYNVNAYIQAKYETPSVQKIVKALSNYGVSANNYQDALKDNNFDLEDDIL